MIIDASYGSPNIKPPMWAIDPGVVAQNAFMIGLPMSVAGYVWGSGNKWPDLSGQGNLGDITGGIWKAGDLYLDGDDYVDCGSKSVLAPTKAITVVVIAKANSLTNHDMLFGKTTLPSLGAGYGLEYYGNEIHFYINHWNAEARKAFTDTSEEHIFVGTYDKQNIRIYIDGVEGTKAVLTDDITSGSDNAYIGRGFNGNNWDGVVKLVEVFPTAFTPSQVATISADPYGLVRQPSMEELWVHVVVVGVAPTAALYGPLFGPLGGPV